MGKTNSNMLWVHNLRSCMILLGLLCHSVFPYMLISKTKIKRYADSFFIVADEHKWFVSDICALLIDTFAMPTLFIIAGFFLKKSLKEKGYSAFVKNKAKRLYVPFLIIGLPTVLLGYFTGYIISNGDFNFANHIVDFVFVQKIPIGHTWFISLLFFYCLFFATTYSYLENACSYLFKYLKNKNGVLIIALVILILTISYAPLSYVLGMNSWMELGLFDFQMNTFFYYYVYLLVGSFLYETNFVTSNNRSSKWGVWLCISILSFVLLALSYDTLNGDLFSINPLAPSGYTLLLRPLTASLFCGFFIVFFKKHMNFSNSLLNALHNRSYAIYLVHFVFIFWVQYLLLDIGISPVFKILIVFITTFLLSWLLAGALKNNSTFLKRIL